MNKKYSLAVLFLGITISVSAQEQKAIEEVTIVSKTQQNISDSSKNITVITSADLAKQKGNSLYKILSQATGFQITGTYNDVAEKTIRVRGGNNSGVIILVDGIPLKDVSGSSHNSADLRLLSVENIDRIEILNGASAVMYGSNATTAVISIITKKASQRPIEVQVGAKGGSYADFSQQAQLSGTLGAFHYQFSGMNQKSDGISTSQGFGFDKDGFEKQNLGAKIGFGLRNFDFMLSSGWNHHLFQYDTGAFSDGKQRGNDQQSYLSANARWNYLNKRGQLTLNTRISGNKRNGEDWKNGAYQTQYVYQGQTIFTELFHQLKVSNSLKITLGGHYEDQKLSYQSLPWGGTELLSNLKMNLAQNNSWEGFAAAHFSHQIFHLEAGARYINHSKFSDHWVYQVSPYLYKNNEKLFLKLGYSFATAFIAPTLYQSYGDGTWVNANPELQPETSQNQEINFSIGKPDRTLVFGATAFQRKEKQVFVYESDPITWKGIYKNVDKNTTKGLELSLDYQILPQIGIGGNFTFIEKDRKEAMLRQPKYRAYSYLSLAVFKGNSLRISHTFVGKKNDVFYNPTTFAQEETEVAGFHLFHLNIRQKINEQLDFYGNVNNIFDKKYVDVVGYTTRGIHFNLGFDYRF